MKIGEVAQRTGIPASTLRYYESVGLLPRPARESGQRVYETSILDHIAVVEIARAAGFSVSEIHRLVRGFAKKTPPGKRWRLLAEKKAVELATRMKQLQQMERILKVVLKCECPTFADCAEVIKRRRKS